jgi:hypothetical protein
MALLQYFDRGMHYLEVAGAALFSSVFGNSKIMFDFATVIPELPARKFFWYDNVMETKRFEYRYYLSKLMTLFTLPHYFKVYPYIECSYLKKYEKFLSLTRNLDKLVEQLVHILQLETKNVFIEKLSNYGLYLHNETAQELPGATLTLDRVLHWWVQGILSKQPVCVLFCYIDNDAGTAGHSVLLALKKSEGHIKYFFLNPHGLYESDVRIQTFRANLERRLEVICNMPVQEMLSTCPRLQEVEQGGNCIQWSAMVFCLLCLNPAWFDDPLPLLQQLGEHPHLNVLLFELAVFIRTLPAFQLRNYYFANFIFAQRTITSVERPLNKCVVEDTTIRSWLYQRFNEKECSTFEPRNCPYACSICNGKCVLSTALKQTDASRLCQLLTPKEIAQEMFVAYIEIKKLARQMKDKRSFLFKQIQGQLDSIVEITSLQDYVTQGLLTNDEVLTISQKYAPTVAAVAAVPTPSPAAVVVAAGAPVRFSSTTSIKKRKRPEDEEEDDEERWAGRRHLVLKK